MKNVLYHIITVLINVLVLSLLFGALYNFTGLLSTRNYGQGYYFTDTFSPLNMGFGINLVLIEYLIYGIISFFKIHTVLKSVILTFIISFFFAYAWEIGINDFPFALIRYFPIPLFAFLLPLVHRFMYRLLTKLFW